MNQQNQNQNQNLTLQQAIALLQNSGFIVRSGKKTAPTSEEVIEIKKLLTRFANLTFIFDRGEIRTPKFLYR